MKLLTTGAIIEFFLLTFEQLMTIMYAKSVNPTCDSIAGLRPRKGAFFLGGLYEASPIDFLHQTSRPLDLKESK